MPSQPTAFCWDPASVPCAATALSLVTRELEEGRGHGADVHVSRDERVPHPHRDGDGRAVVPQVDVGHRVGPTERRGRHRRQPARGLDHPVRQQTVGHQRSAGVRDRGALQHRHVLERGLDLRHPHPEPGHRQRTAMVRHPPQLPLPQGTVRVHGEATRADPADGHRECRGVHVRDLLTQDVGHRSPRDWRDGARGRRGWLAGRYAQSISLATTERDDADDSASQRAADGRRASR